MDKILASLQVIFRDAFDDDEIVLQDSTCANDIEGWDSLMQMNLIVLIEKEFQIKFTVAEILALRNVGDMVVLIQQKLN